MSLAMAQNDKTTGTSTPKTPGTPGTPGTPKAPGLEPLGFKSPDPEAVSRSMSDIAERSQRIVADWLKRHPPLGGVGKARLSGLDQVRRARRGRQGHTAFLGPDRLGEPSRPDDERLALL